jgi:MFS family permease
LGADGGHDGPVTTEGVTTAALHLARRVTFGFFGLLGLGVNSWLVRIPDVKSALDLGAAQLGLLLLVGAAGTVLAIIPAGRQAARRGSAPVVRFGALTFAASIALLAMVWSPLTLALALFAFGVFAAITDVAINSHAVTVEKAFRSSQMNRFHATYSLGALVGVGVGGVLAELAVPVLWHLLGIAALMALSAHKFAPALLPGAVDRHVFTEARDRKRLPMTVWLLGVIGVAAAIGEGAAGDWSAVHLREDLGASPFLGSLGLAGFTVMMVIGRFLGDALTNRYRSDVLLLGCSVLAGGGLVAGLALGTVPAVIAGWVCAGLGLSIVIPVLFSAAGRIAGVPQAHALAAVSGVTYVGFLAGPPVIGFLAEAVGLGTALMAPAALILITAVLIRPALHPSKAKSG